MCCGLYSMTEEDDTLVNQFYFPTTNATDSICGCTDTFAWDICTPGKVCDCEGFEKIPCNCDGGEETGVDEGFITREENLPILEFVVDDTGKTNLLFK